MNIDENLILKEEEQSLVFYFSGVMILGELQTIEKRLGYYETCYTSKEIVCDLSQVQRLDSAAVLMLLGFMRKMEREGCSTRVMYGNSEFERLFEMVRQHAHFDNVFKPAKDSFLASIGKKVAQSLKTLTDFFTFFGVLSAAMLHYILFFRSFRWREILFEMNESAIKALGIIALTMFLVGIVIAYQSSVQLKIYGANIFIVDMLGISILRELAPMLTAIIVAGRSGSAYAAQIGVMKITEELDAMRTMGFDPYAFLVLPRLLALMIMMPILIFTADIMGVLGGMLIANLELGLSPSLFLDRFAEVIEIRHFWVGMLKGPFFAILIASISIFHGMMVKNDTQSIGFNTTRSVVESIFAVIICDAVFSIIFTNLGI